MKLLFSNVLQTRENIENHEALGRVLFIVVKRSSTLAIYETRVYEVAFQSSILNL